VIGLIKKLVQFKLFIQLLAAAAINFDLAAVSRLITSGKATISSLPTKAFCAGGLNCYSCPAAGWACPVGSLQFWFNDINERIRFNQPLNLAGLYIIGFLSLIGGLAGRICCGWVCPFGFLQDLINKITRRNFRIPSVFRSVRYISLFLFVLLLPLVIWDFRFVGPWFCKYLCPSGTLTAGLPLLVVDEGLRASASWITVFKMSLMSLFLVSFLFSRRSFCKTLCPLGTIWGFFNRFSLFTLKIDQETCINCGKCERTCSMHIPVRNEQNDNRCIRCLECLKNCPVNAISFKIHKSEKFFPAGVESKQGENK
jgi:ferredoxin-type protein NapH